MNILFIGGSSEIAIKIAKKSNKTYILLVEKKILDIIKRIFK